MSAIVLTADETAAADSIIGAITDLSPAAKRRVISTARVFLGLASPRRQPSVATLIKRAEKAGRRVTSVTTPDGTTLNFGEGEPSEANNPWLASTGKEKQ